MAWNNVFLNNKFILYGRGISNKSVEIFFKKNHVKYLYVEDDFDIYEKYIIIKSPGIPNDTPFLKRCDEHNLLIINDIELFYILRKNVKYIGITGTCGKTTTATLLYNIMKEKYKVKLCGNIGIPIFEFIEEELEYLIIELSSFQLEYIKSFKPNFFIVLNIFKHHLNHHYTFNNYLASKLKPLKNMRKEDLLIINESCISFLRARNYNFKVYTFSNDLKADIVLNDDEILFKDIKININNYEYFKYDFNVLNFLSLIVIIDYLKIKDFLEVIKNFKNLPHRMEEIYNENKLVIINDSKSTSFNSLLEGINYCKKQFNKYNLTIILGGKIDLDEIKANIEIIKSLVKFNIYCYGENRYLISQEISCITYETLDEIIDNILINKPLVILFSPAAQSLDQFKSYIERGETFKKLIINKLKN